MKRFRLGPIVLGFLFSALPAAAAAPVEYLQQIKPLLTVRCYACHGALQQRAGLRVDTAALLRQGSDRGPVIVPGNSAESLLLDHVRGSKGLRRMPPPSEGETLKEAEIALLKAWIDQGALGPAAEKPDPDPREHWAFRAPTRPPLPRVGQGEFVRNAVDAFIVAGWEKHALTPQPPAGKAILLRRVYLDLIGLPPTRQELAAFLMDASPDAYEKVVDRLLASPAYGERWGRHWMDIWRYSDWWGLGADVRNSQKHIWHWRDWILDALNADKGYDQMLREMLAADELYPTDLDKLRATGFLVRSYFKFNRDSWLDDTVEHTFKALVGLTLNCARCHDHKYDPLAQLDYYRMRAFFEPYQVRHDQVPGNVDFEKDGIPRVFDCNLNAPTYRYLRGDDKQPDKAKPLTPALPPLLALGELKIEPVDLPLEGHFPGIRPYVLDDQLRLAEQQIVAARQALVEAQGQPVEIALKEKTLAAAVARPAALRARAAADRARLQPAPVVDATVLARTAARLEREAVVLQAVEELARAELKLLNIPATTKARAEKQLEIARDAVTAARKALKAPGETYTPLSGSLKTLESNTETEASRSKPYPTQSTGRRTALARWLTDPRHPLTARVAVNHVWARHFGKPLVGTVFDFGRKGARPAHPELLDYLAVELRDHGWSLKHLHRLLVTSNTYRLTSSSAGASAETTSADPENRLLWRMNPVRMEAQVVRDSLLHLAGELDPQLGGPSLDPVRTADSRRRSLYFVHSHNEQHRFLAIFDDANVLECYRRAESIVPQQALALTNSRFALTMAQRINDRLHEHLGTVTDHTFVSAAFELLLASRPTADELAACEQALCDWKRVLGSRPDASLRARGDLIQALANHNDFVTIR